MNDLASYPLNMWSSKPIAPTPVAAPTQPTFARPAELQKQPVMGVPTAVMPVKMKRGHVSKACTNCRKMHAGCDHARPCSRCVFHRMESTCMDVPRKKRISKKKKPEEGETDITSSFPSEEVLASSLMDKTKASQQSTSLDNTNNNSNSTNEKIWKDTFNELFGDITSPQVPFSPSPSPYNVQPLLFADLLGTDKVHSDLLSSQPTRDMRDLAREMDELRRSNVLLETKLNSVTSELVEMRQKMQQMLQLLGGFFVPQASLGQNEF